jgi:toxin ParE1/3/4
MLFAGSVKPVRGLKTIPMRVGLRSVVATPHVVFYRVVADEVEIVRVIDGRRDIDQIFADGETM